jgi:subtilase family serine protease
LAYSTYLGGGGEDFGQGIAVDAAGKAYVTGTTSSTNFPLTAIPLLQTAFGGKSNPFGGDAFVTKLNAAGSALDYSSYLGGTGDDFGVDIAVDPTGNAYLIGVTTSTNFPRLRPVQATFGGAVYDVFLAKIAASLSPDLVVTVVTGPTKGALGQSLAVTTTVENQGPLAATAFSVGIYLSTDNAITTGDTLLATFNVSSLAPGASVTLVPTLATPVTVPMVPGTGTYYLGAIADPDPAACPPGGAGAVVELDACNNAKAAATQITVTEFKPDLVVTSVVGPDKSAPGLPIQLAATVENQGPAAAGAFTVELYLSSNTVFDGPGTDFLLGSFTTATNLAAGARLSFTTTGTVPVLALAPYYILAVADSNSAVPVVELDDANNTGVSTAQITITDTKPDLVITSLTVPATGARGNTVAVTTGVGNSGPVAAGAFTVTFYLSADAILDGGDTLLAETQAVAGLAAAANTSTPTTVTIPIAMPIGLYFLLAKADSAGVVAELDEANNVGATGTKINVVSDFLPDLTVSAVTAPAKAGKGQNVEVTATVKNIGPKDAGPFTVGLYGSTGTPVTTGDDLRASRALPSLAAGAQTTFTMTVQIPPGTATGNYFLGAIADTGLAEAELDETPASNAKTAAATAVTDFKPDLKLTPLATGDVKGQLVSAGSSSDKGVGRVLNVTTKITNDGPAPAPAFVVEAYLSTDAVIDPTADRLLGRQTVPGLQPGETVTIVVSGAIPSELCVGAFLPVPPDTCFTDPTAAATFYVGVKVDPADLVDELEDLTNNDSTLLLDPALSGIATLPELEMTSFSGPKFGAAGKPITVTGTVKNILEPAGTFTVDVYLSLDATFDPGDIFVGRLLSVPSLGRGASTSGTATLTIPATGVVTGLYSLIAVADKDNQVPEYDDVLNNAKVATDQIEIKEFKPDFVVKTVSGPAKGAQGKPLTMTVSVENKGPAPSGLFTVGLYLSTDNSIDQTDTLLGSVELASIAPGGTGGGSKEVKIPPLQATGMYYLGAFADPDLLIPETPGVGVPDGEANNGKAATSQIDIQLFTPDLIVSAISGPAQGAVGKTVEVATTVKNDGQGDAGPFTVGLYLSADNTIDTTDTFLGSVHVTDLKAGATSSATTTVTIPRTITPGTGFYLGAIADPANAIAELDPNPLLGENNNAKESSTLEILALLPDLKITAVSGPTKGAPGRPIDVTFTVKNDGTAPVGAFMVRLLLSSDGTITTGLPDIALGSDVSVESLEAGASATKTTTVTLPIPPDIVLTAGVGTYTLGAYADPLNNVMGELGPTGETNNALAGNQIKITTKPDLTVTAVIAPVSGFPGQPVEMTVTVENKSPAAAGAFTVGLYFSTDGSITAADRLLATLSFGSMEAGANSTAKTMVTIPSDVIPGDYSLGAFADPTLSVDELDEANNAKAALPAIKIALLKPDLVATTVTGPDKGSPGKPIVVTTEVENQGPAAAGAFEVGIFLSADNALDPAVDRFLGSRIVTSLAAGKTVTTSSPNPVIPADVLPGTYFLIAVADYKATVGEQKEDNNVATASIVIVAFKPDLSIASVITPFRVAAGQSVPVTVTVKNSGPLAAAASVGIYMSPVGVPNDPPDGAFKAGTIDPVKHRLLSVPSAGTVGANASLTGTFTVVIPKDVAPAPYFLGAYADPGALVDELDEANNGSFALNFVTVTPALPDLVISSATVPPVGNPGKPLSVVNTVKNQGTAAAGPFAVKFYLSQSSSLMPVADRFIGSRAVGGLGAGALSTATTAVTIPPDVPPGTYHLDIVANPDGFVVELDETNNGDSKLIEIKPFLPDLTVTSVSGPAKAAVSQSVTMTATVENKGSADATTAFSVSLYLSTDLIFDAADRFIGVLPVSVVNAVSVKAGASVTTPTPTLPTVLTIPADLPPGKYFFVAVADSGAKVAELDETNNVKLSSGTIEVTPFLPDFVVTAVSVPATANPGKPITIATTVQNQGPVNAGPTTVGLFLSTDTGIDPATDRSLGTQSVPALLAGAFITVTTSVTIPADVPLGQYFIGALADPGTTVAEVAENNNLRLSAFAIKLFLPDLVMTTLSGPATGAAGQKITVSNAVKNQGQVAAGALAVGLYLSTDGIIDPATDRFLGSRSLSSLGIGANSIVATQVTIPADVEPGSYFLGAVADVGNDVAEQDDANNTMAAANPAVITLFKPDLVMTAVSTTAVKVVPGAMISVSSTVKNQGPAIATGPFTVGLYLATSPTVDPATARFLGTRSIASLSTGASSLASTSVTIPGDVVPGSYFIGAVVDPGSAVGELDETNNALAGAAPIKITPAQSDLVVTAVTTTATRVVVGATISVSSTVKNEGPAAATPTLPATTFTVGLYLSADALFDATDQLLANRPPLASLAAGASSAATTSAPTPAVAPGAYFILAVADSGQSVAELDETNNTRATVFPIEVAENKPDLVVTTVTGPTAGVLGKSITVTATVKNQGPAAAGAFSVGFYFSADPLIDSAADTLLGTKIPVASLAKGASITLTKTAAIPVVPPGPYFLGVVADDGSPIPVVELDETNNARAALNRITIADNKPDLVVTTVSVPSTGGVGQMQPIAGIVGKTLVVTTTVKNQGTTPAGAFGVSVYRSNDPVFDGGDLPLGTRTVASLAAGAVSTGPITTIPLAVPGSYFLLVVADPGLAVTESDETNNVKPLASLFPIKDNLPDLVMTAVSGPFQQAVGKTISVSNTVKNQGSLAAGAFTIQFTLEPGGLALTGGTRSVTSLGVGATNTLSTTVTIPLATPPGDYVLLAVVDFGGTVVEQDEGNNDLFAFLPIRITDNKPDLVVTAVSGPLMGAVGKTIAVTNTVENQGHAPAGSSRVDFYLSVDNLFSTAGDNFQLTGSRTLTLAAGAISSATTTVTIPASGPGTVPPGTYYLLAVADAANAVPTELDETNNTRASLTQITITADKPDLVMTAVSGPATGIIGKTIAVANTARNQGSNTTGVSSRIDFYLSVDNLFSTAGDNFQLTGSRTVSSLAGGAISTGTTTVTIPASGPGTVPQGTYYLLAFADAANAVTNELDETNNTLASDLQIVVTADLPDLVMTVVAGPSVGVAGMTIPVTTAVLNSGSKSAPTTSQATFYLSTDSDITAADTLLTGPLAVPISRTISALAVKASSTGTTTVTIPPGVLPGDYYVGAIVDQAGAVTEREEVTNNTRAAASTITVLPNVARTYTPSLGTITESRCLNPLLDGNGDFNTTLTIAPHTGVKFSGSAAGTIVLPAANATFDETMTITGALTALDKLAGTFTVTTKQGLVFVGSGSGTFSGTIQGGGALDLVFEGQDQNGVTCRFLRTITINP